MITVNGGLLNPQVEVLIHRVSTLYKHMFYLKLQPCTATYKHSVRLQRQHRQPNVEQPAEIRSQTYLYTLILMLEKQAKLQITFNATRFRKYSMTYVCI